MGGCRDIRLSRSFLRVSPLRTVGPSRLFARQCPRHAVPSRTFRSSSPASSNVVLGSDLFEYTSGRWIWNDTLRHSERRRLFNVSGLIDLAAASVNQNARSVARFEKFAEGGFNRTFLMTMNDKSEFIVRIPYPLVQPKSLVVASEVATMRYLRSKGLPVPEVFGYSTTSDNAAETEYIVMECIHGINMGDIWFDMPNEARQTAISKLVALESRLFDMSFPASGSLYYARDLPAEAKRVDIPGTDFCIGPDISVHMWYGRRAGLDVDRGPYEDMYTTLAAGAIKEMAYLTKFGRPVPPMQRLRRETYQYQLQSHIDQLRNLEQYLSIVPHLVLRKDSLQRPAIRHPDLNPNNVIITNDLEVQGLIDWQHAVILPLILQQGIPDMFQNWGDDVSEKLQFPTLPDDIESLSEKEQFQQVELYRRRHLHYHYVGLTSKLNRTHFDALISPFSTLTRKLYHFAKAPWEGDNVTLRATLIQIAQQWSDLVTSLHPPLTKIACPITFSADEQATCLHLFDAQTEADEQMQVCIDVIGAAGSEGWVPNERYVDAKQCADQLKVASLSGAENENEREIIEKNWPFDDLDEDEYT